MTYIKGFESSADVYGTRHQIKCLRYCFNMDYFKCNYGGCSCLAGFVPVLGGSLISKNDIGEESSADERSSTGSYTYYSTHGGSYTGSGDEDWVSYESQGCSKDGLGYLSPANTPYKVTDEQDIDWSLDKACWFADNYVRYCDHYWRTDADSPRKCLEDCQNHEHCQKATWFLQENESSAGEPVCFMFPVGAAECEWDGGQYVRPARGQSIECQGPRCGPAKSKYDDCFAGSNTPTYCKYTRKSDEEIGSGSGDGSEDGFTRDYSPYYASASDNYEYRCSACPETPGECTFFNDNDYPTRSSGGGSMDILFHQEGWAECIKHCFNMDFSTCNDVGCNCLESSEFNYQEIDNFGTSINNYGSALPFASWDSAGCAHHDEPDEPDEPTTLDRCWFSDDFVYYCDPDYNSLVTDTAEECLAECSKNSTCYRAAWHPGYAGSADDGTTDSAICYMFQVGSQQCSWNDYIEKPEDAKMIECLGELCDWNHSEDHGGCGSDGQRAFCDLNYLNLRNYYEDNDKARDPRTA